MANEQKKKQTVKTSASGRVQAAAAGSQSRAADSKRRSALVWSSLVVLVLLALGAWFVLGRQHAGGQGAAAPVAMKFPGTAYPSQGHQGHQPGDLKRYAHFQYSTDPPTSGFHQEIFTTGFVENRPIPKYVQVHLLEHGNVLLQYNCMCPDTVNALARIAAEFDSRLTTPGAAIASQADVQNAEEQGLAVIVAPYPGIKTPIALTAWTRLGTLQQPEEAKIISFINLYLHNTDNLNR